MKGVVFTEFLEMVESNYGMEIADRVQSKGSPLDVGFTSVGTYDYRILINLIVELRQATGTPVRDLVLGFGKHLFHRFRSIYPDSMEGVTNTIELLQKVETQIHDEVAKLYPDAELPRFAFAPSAEGHFQMEYISNRPFADLAEGLIEASIEHYRDDVQLERVDLDGTPGTHAFFCLKPKLHRS